MNPIHWFMKQSSVGCRKPPGELGTDTDFWIRYLQRFILRASRNQYAYQDPKETLLYMFHSLQTSDICEQSLRRSWPRWIHQLPLGMVMRWTVYNSSWASAANHTSVPRKGTLCVFICRQHATLSDCFQHIALTAWKVTTIFFDLTQDFYCCFSKNRTKVAKAQSKCVLSEVWMKKDFPATVWWVSRVQGLLKGHNLEEPVIQILPPNVLLCWNFFIVLPSYSLQDGNIRRQAG